MLQNAQAVSGKINVVFLDNENGIHGGFFRLALVASTSSSWELV